MTAPSAQTYYRACVDCGKVKRKPSPAPYCNKHGRRNQVEEARRAGRVMGSRTCGCGRRKASYREKCTACRPAVQPSPIRVMRPRVSMSKLLGTQRQMQTLTADERAEREQAARQCAERLARELKPRITPDMIGGGV